MSTEGEVGMGWGRDRLKRRLQNMDDFQFEHLVADLWRLQGWQAEVEQQSGDAGVDVRATKDTPYSQKVLIQAKRYSESNPVGGPDIQQYAALKQQEDGVDQVLVVTTGRFTSAARSRAEELNVKLVDGDDLVDLLTRLDARDLVADYFGEVDEFAEGEDETESQASTTATGQRTADSPITRPLMIIGVLCALVSPLLLAGSGETVAMVFVVTYLVLPAELLIDSRAYPDESDLVRGGLIISAMIPGLSVMIGVVYLRRRFD